MADNTVEVVVKVTDLDKNLDSMETFYRLMLQMTGKTVNMNFNIHGISQANSALGQTESTLSKIANVISTISSAGAGVSSAISGFASGIADAFSGMASILNTDFSKIAYATVAHQITRSVIGAIPQVIQRYDIMNTFTDYMRLAGVDSETANSALSRVDQSIRGIPIGLDEAAFRLRRYQMYLGDIDRATNLTIGVQNALMAGGASEQMRNTAYTQIDRLLATGKLSQARQWMSLFNGLGVSLRFLKDELALDPTMSMQQVASDLASGAIATNDFLHAMERLADNEGLSQALTIYKGTIEAWMANIKNAIKRGGQAVMEAMNDVMEDQFGQGITDVLKTVRDEIDAIAQSTATFIRQNPQFLGMLGEVLGGLLDRVRSTDFGGFIGKLVENLGRLGDIIFRIFDNLPDGFLTDFVSFAVTLAGPLSAIFKMVSGGLPIILGVFERMKDMDFADLIEKIVHQVENLANIVAKVLSLIPDGLLGDLMAFGLVWGKPLAHVISSISGALTNLFKGLSGMGGSGGFGAFGRILGTTGGAWITAAVAGIGTITYAVHSLIESWIDARNEFAKGLLEGIHGTYVIDSVNQAVKASDDLQFNARNSLEEINDTYENALSSVNRIREINEEIGKTTNLERRKELLQELADAQGNYNSALDVTAENLSGNENLAANYARLVTANQTVAAYKESQASFITQNVKNQLLLEDLQGQMQERRNYIRFLNGQLPGGYSGTAQGLVERLRQAQNGYLPYMSTAEQIRIGNMLAAYNQEQEGLKADEEQEKQLQKEIQQNIELYKEYGERAEEVQNKIDELMMIDYSPLGGEAAFSTLDDGLQKTIASFDEFKDAADEAINSVVGGFQKIEPLLREDVYEDGKLKEEHEILTGQDVLDNLGSQVTFMDDLNEQLKQTIRYMYENQGSSISGLLGELAGLDPTEMAKAIEGVNEILADTDMTAQLTELFNGREAGKSLYTTLVAGIQEAAEDPELWEKMQGNWNWLFDPEVAKDIFGEDFMATVEETAQDALAPLNEELEATADNAGEAKVAVGNMAEAMVARMGVVNTFAQTMRNLAGNIGAAEGAALGLARAINNIPSNKHVRVSYDQYGFSMPYSSLSTGVGGKASGGIVDGVPVPSMAIGTDTIPMMLTPGEYVVRRDAVNMFGQTFLEAVNGMDVGAAYDAMMSRVSVPHGSTYNYYDNHAAVNMNFYGNTGQDFSQRKAFNFISKL